ncbi:threonine/serine exporter family protein [Thermomonospora umbrina]|uniref:Uncharacterized membrane protein YjjP (DUF1212 family) n=1 Tax=Thermomonospora umbrina TaxID=111806 RepID=A0A3D9SXY0_9ACTN|nr:threonine/serine exporter family protein [Thermomonospora umbrina]REF00810.1 uncharacterized membrane protein YjjP (DUF1212 family) [Thermomonospora umbrina]
MKAYGDTMAEAAGRARTALRHWAHRHKRKHGPSKGMPLLARLRGTEFADVTPEGETLSPAEAREVMEFLLDLSEQMFVGGSETRMIETSIIAAAASLGLTHMELAIVAGRTVTLQYAPPGTWPLVMIRVARTDDSRDLVEMAALHTLVEDVVAGRVDREEGERRLAGIRRMVPVWPGWVRMAGGAVLAASISLQANGTLFGALTAMVVLVVANRAGWLLGRSGIPSFYVVIVQSATVVSLGLLTLEMGLLSAQNAASMTAANLVLLLPTLTVVSLAQDALTGFGVTAAVRLISVVLSLGALFTGIVSVGVLAPNVQVVGGSQGLRFVALPVGVYLLTAVIGSAANAISMGGAARLILYAALGGLLAAVARRFGVTVLELPIPMAVLLAATVLGTVGGYLSPRVDIPSPAFVLPGIAGTLLPSTDVYRGLAQYSAGAPGAGRYLLAALLTTTAIGAGVVLGNILGARGGRVQTSRNA